MPKGPNGEWRPADAVGCAVTVARIATGERGETDYNQIGGPVHPRRQATSRTMPNSRAIKREAFVLAAMVPAGKGLFSPVQIQKLLFLLDENVAKQTDKPHFNYQPYHYGPFDKNVYEVLEQLEKKGLVEVKVSGVNGRRTYGLTDVGHRAGSEAFRGIGGPFQEYIKEAVHFVRTLSFPQLVRAIYKAYPKMKKNSVFGIFA